MAEMDVKTAAAELLPRKAALEFVFEVADERIVSMFKNGDDVVQAKHLYDASKLLQQALLKTLMDGEDHLKDL